MWIAMMSKTLKFVNITVGAMEEDVTGACIATKSAWQGSKTQVDYPQLSTWRTVFMRRKSKIGGCCLLSLTLLREKVGVKAGMFASIGKGANNLSVRFQQPSRFRLCLCMYSVCTVFRDVCPGICCNRGGTVVQYGSTWLSWRTYAAM